MKGPKITKFGYKLFESKDGITLQPLFIDKKEIFPIGEWIEAMNIEYHPNFSHRPGIHVGCNLPSAVWLMDANGKYKSRFKHGQRVWCIVEYDATIDYNEEVSKLPGKCFKTHCPENGYYNFLESRDRDWIITSAIRIIKIISEEERQQILKEMNYDEAAAFAPYKAAMEKRMKNCTNIQN